MRDAFVILLANKDSANDFLGFPLSAGRTSLELSFLASSLDKLKPVLESWKQSIPTDDRENMGESNINTEVLTITSAEIRIYSQSLKDKYDAIWRGYYEADFSPSYRIHQSSSQLVKWQEKGLTKEEVRQSLNRCLADMNAILTASKGGIKNSAGTPLSAGQIFDEFSILADDIDKICAACTSLENNYSGQEGGATYFPGHLSIGLCLLRLRTSSNLLRNQASSMIQVYKSKNDDDHTLALLRKMEESIVEISSWEQTEFDIEKMVKILTDWKSNATTILQAAMEEVRTEVSLSKLADLAASLKRIEAIVQRIIMKQTQAMKEGMKSGVACMISAKMAIPEEGPHSYVERMEQIIANAKWHLQRHDDALKNREAIREPLHSLSIISKQVREQTQLVKQRYEDGKFLYYEASPFPSLRIHKSIAYLSNWEENGWTESEAAQALTHCARDANEILEAVAKGAVNVEGTLIPKDRVEAGLSILADDLEKIGKACAKLAESVQLQEIAQSAREAAQSLKT